MGHYSEDYQLVRRLDFAFEPRGSFRMATTNIANTTAKTFAEWVATTRGSHFMYQVLTGFILGFSQDR